MSEVVVTQKTLRIEGGSDAYLSKNAHPRDKYMHFDEPTHIYTIDGYPEPFVSGTTIIHEFIPHFDTVGVINNILKNPKHKNDPTYKYYQMTKEAILEQWKNNGKDASDRGTEMHLCIELYLNRVPVVNKTIEYQMFMDYGDIHNIREKIYRTEFMIYANEEQIAGSIDALVKNDDGTYTIVDWKRAKKIDFKAFGNNRMKEPFQYLQDCNYVHYSMQLNLYRYILQKYYGFVISEMYLVVCHPNNREGTFEKIILPFMDKEIQMIMDRRIIQLKEKGIYTTERLEEKNSIKNTLTALEIPPLPNNITDSPPKKRGRPKKCVV